MRFKSFPLRRGKRDAQRGAAALEFALASFFLVPLLLGMLDYSYYFYIGLNVVEAQRAGLVTAARETVGTCGVGASVAQQNAKTQAASDAAAAVQAYLGNNSLSSVLTLTGDTPTCSAAPADPTWTMTLIADFPPILGRVMPWDKTAVSGKVRYTAHKLAMLGN
jgi:Flp pilus assembly protein TadG